MKLRASIRWVFWILGALILGAVIALMVYLRTPVPAPVVGLELLRFEQEGTNLYAVFVLKNKGSVRVWSDPFDWQMEVESNGQRSTNNPTRLSWYDWHLQPGSDRIFGVPVPADAYRWRVIRYYSYMNQPSLRWDYIDLLPDRKNAGILDVWIAGALGQLDSDPDEIDTVTSQYITNASMPLPVKLDGVVTKSLIPSFP